MILILATVALTIGVYLLHRNYQYWTKRGVPGPKPVLLIGNLAPSFLKKMSLAELYSQIYSDYPNAPLVGIFKTTTPAIVLRDPELIRDIAVKSFSSFHDNELKLEKSVDPILGRNPFFAWGEEWRSIRVHLTPGFTSGKMKLIFPLLEQVSKQFVQFIANHPDTTKGFEAKELCSRFTLTTVGSCAFGLETRAFEEENNEFKQIADRIFGPEGFQPLKILMVGLVPSLNKLVSIRITPTDVEEKLVNIITQTLKYREENNVVRNDFLQILHQISKNNTDGTFKDIDVVAHAAGFLGDGYNTSAITMSFLLYELAANAEAQSKLREEIQRSFEENEDNLSYEVLQSLPYLDAALNEALRLHPPLGSLQKLCTKPYTYVPKENDVIKNPVHIEPFTPVIMPLYGLHRDPKYFEEPNSFKPKRFLGDNKNNLRKYVFMPFGEGPRSCLGQRFGILQVKVGVVHVIKNYYISVNKKTTLPIEYDPVYMMTLAKNGLWLDFKKIV